jgi:hypothetical protein
MSEKWQAVLAGSTIAAGLGILMFTAYASPWLLIYPARPGVALTNLIIWLTDGRLLLIPYAGIVVFVAGNAILYSVICYLALRLRLRWKK